MKHEAKVVFVNNVTESEYCDHALAGMAKSLGISFAEICKNDLNSARKIASYYKSLPLKRRLYNGIFKDISAKEVSVKTAETKAAIGKYEEVLELEGIFEDPENILDVHISGPVCQIKYKNFDGMVLSKHVFVSEAGEYAGLDHAEIVAEEVYKRGRAPEIRFKARMPYRAKKAA